MMITLTLLALFALQPSQPPAPTARDKEQQPAAQQTQPTQTQPAPPQRGTNEHPLVVKPLRSQEQTDEDRADRLDQQANRRQSFWLSVVTLLVLGFQAWLLKRQIAVMDVQREIMDQQRAAADTQARHMADGLEETRKATAAAIASADALKVIHRQWLEVRSWQCAVESISTKPDDLIQATVSITITNTSQLPLTIRTVRCYINRYKGGHAWSNTILGPHATSTESVFLLLPETEKNTWKTKGSLTFVVAGWVHFWDAFGEPQEQMIGAWCKITQRGHLTVRGVGDLPRNLRRMSTEDPWPMSEPD